MIPQRSQLQQSLHRACCCPGVECLSEIFDPDADYFTLEVELDGFGALECGGCYAGTGFPTTRSFTYHGSLNGTYSTSGHITSIGVDFITTCDQRGRHSVSGATRTLHAEEACAGATLSTVVRDWLYIRVVLADGTGAPALGSITSIDAYLGDSANTQADDFRVFSYLRSADTVDRFLGYTFSHNGGFTCDVNNLFVSIGTITPRLA